MKKRIAALILVAVMVLGILPATAFATGDFTISLSDETADVGEYITLAVAFANMPDTGIGSFTYTLDYPKDTLELVGFAQGSITGTFRGGVQTGVVTWYSDAAFADNGDNIFSVTFKVKEGALNGKYDVKLLETELVTLEYDAVSAVYEAGSVTVTGGLEVTPDVVISTTETEYTYGDEVQPLVATVTNMDNLAHDEGYPIFHWFKTSADTNGVVQVHTGDTYTPEVDYVEGGAYYWCEPANKYNGNWDMSQTRSNTINITFHKADQDVGYGVEHTVYGDTDLTDNIEIFKYVGEDEIDVSANCTYLINGGTYTYAELGNLKLNAGNYNCVVTIPGDDNHNEAEVEFTLKVGKATPGMTVAPPAVTVVKNLTEQLNVTWTGVVDGDELIPTFKSKKTSIATVDANGLITGVKVGETTITVSFAGNENYNKVDDVTITVTVTDKLLAEVTFGASAAEKTYTEAGYTLGDFITAEATADQADGTITYSFNGQTYTWAELQAVPVKNVGTYEVTAQFVSDTHVGSASVTVEIVKAEQAALVVTVADGITYGDDLGEAVTVEGGSTDGEVICVVRDSEGGLAYVGDLAYAELNAGEYTVEVTMAGDENYNEVSAVAALVINKVKVAIPTAKTGLTYTGEVQVGVEDGEHYYVVSGGSNVTAGGYMAWVSLNDTTNYEWSEPFGGKVEWQIDKAAAENLTAEVSLRYNDTTAKDILDMIVGKLPGAETRLAVTSATTESALVVIGEDKTTFALAEGLEEQEASATIVVKFTSLNYEESTMTITVNVMEKDELPEGVLTITGGTLTYNGKAQTWEKAKLKSGYNKANLTYTYSGNMTDAGTYTVTVVYDDGVNYGEASATVVIDPAKPDIKFTRSGIKKGMILDELIENGNLTVTVTFGGETVTGTFTWNEEEGTEIKRGKSYNYTFTPDSANFQTFTGKYKPLASSSGGGGGSSSSSSVTYVDVQTSDWFSGAVDYVTNLGLMNGTGDGTTFEPGTDVTRAMVVVTLWRMEGSPEVKYDMAFTDVADGLWYTEAIRWAASKGIVTGYDDGTAFGPTDVITREQLATMLYRYANRSAASGDPLASFPDGAETSAWAKEGMSWAVSVGLLSGDGEGDLNPTDTASRAELATILMRYVQNVR